jgi:hypothetical protein
MEKTLTWSGKHEDNENRIKDFWLSQSPIDRLKAAFYLNSIAYKFDIKNPPKMDKTYSYTRKRNG